MRARAEATEPSAAAATATLSLECALAPEAAARLLRHPALAPRRLGRPRAAAATVVFHDTAEGTLAQAGLALAVEPRGRGAVQRLVRSLPADGAAEPARPLPVLAETRLARPVPDPAPLADLLPKGHALLAVAAAVGRRVSLALAGEASLTLFAGSLRAVAAERPFARLLLALPAARAAEGFDLLRALAADRPLLVPATTLAEEARALALGVPARPLWQGGPDLAGAATVEDGARRAIGQLTLALLAAAPIAAAGNDPEGVHQVRVAIRRLRTALTLFRPAIDCAEIAALKDRLGTLARTLGPARDWDIFLGGTLAEIRAAFAQEAAIAALGRAAEAARADAYRAVRAALAAPEFRLLALDLAAAVTARPWHGRGDTAAEAAAPLEGFADATLARLHRRLLRAGEGFAGLEIEALHALRLKAKRLRYAGELFGALFPGKKRRRFQKALAALQDALGHLNDTAVAAALMRALGGRGKERAFAAGVVQGWVAAKAQHARETAAEAWAEFIDRPPFWEA